MRTANPALNSKTFADMGYVTEQSRAMTIEGTVNKTGFLMILLLAGAWWTWNLFFPARNPAAIYPWLMGGAPGAQ